MEDFIEEFQLNPQEASDLFNSKETYRKAKLSLYVLFGLFYFGFLALVAIGFDSSDIIIRVFYGLIGIGIVCLLIVIGVLYLDIRGYDYFDEDLVYHELAQAINDFSAAPSNIEGWKNHLSNVSILLRKHDAKAFSKYRERRILEYITHITDRENNGLSESTFTQFYNLILSDVLEDRKGEIDKLINQVEVSDSGTQQSHFMTIRKSIGNLWNRWKINRWLPLVIALAVGLSIYYFIDEQLGFLVTTALLTIIHITRGENH